jgi:type I restriction enzyme, S subunit
MNKLPKYPAYKPSGVDWLGEIPEHWNLLSNKNIFKLKKNQVGKKSGDFVLLSLTLNGVIERDMVNPQGKFPAEFDTYQEVRKGDFIFCLFDVEETPRCVGLSDFDGMITGAYTVMELNKNFNRKYLYYFYLNLDFDKRFKPLYTGLRNTISKENFFSFKSFVPPLPEQTAIAEFLDRKTTLIDQAIDIKQKQIELLKERRQILIHRAVTRGIGSLSGSETPDVKLKDSGVEWIGKIPEHWEVVKLKFVCDFINDGTHGSYPRAEHGYRLLSVRNMIDDKFVFRDDDSRVSEKHFKEISSKFQIEKGDLQLAIVGATLGKVAIVDEYDELFVTQRSVCTIRLKKNIYSNRFLFYFMKSQAFQSYLWLNAGFSAQPGVYLGTIQNSSLPFPPYHEQDLIVDYLAAVFLKYENAISFKEQEIEKLKEYKASLINEVVTGKIKISKI